MKLIQYKIDNRILKVEGTNQVGDFLISLACWPRHGVHAGAWRAAVKILRNVDWGDFDSVEGHSMGGSIAMVTSRITGKRCVVKGAFPVFLKPGREKGIVQIYGSDIVTRLFPWFGYGTVKKERLVRLGPGNCFTDHMGY